MDYKKLKIEGSHLGKFRTNSEEHGFNTILISGPTQKKLKDWETVGRLVQVRKKSGMFGSDTILIRQLDGGLMSHENQSFCSISDEFKDYYDELFKELKPEEPGKEYDIQGKHKASGFVVEGMDCTYGESNSIIIITKY